jgi:hypothetical protein
MRILCCSRVRLHVCESFELNNLFIFIRHPIFFALRSRERNRGFYVFA